MTIYTFAIYMFFIFVLGKNTYAIDVQPVTNSINGKTDGDYLWVSDSKVSNLPLEPLEETDGEGMNSYRFLRVIFKDKLYAFQRTSSDTQDGKMFIWTSSDNGVTWEGKSNVPCVLDKDEGNCDVMSSMIVNNELVVIYGNDTQYAIAKSTDGVKWEVGTAIERDSMANKRILYYSGIPSDLPGHKENENKYVACYESDEYPDTKENDEHVTVAVCALSVDDGESWKAGFYLRVKTTVTGFSGLDQMSFFQEDAYFIAETDKESNVLFVCKPESEPAKDGGIVMHCVEAGEDPEKLIPVLNVNCDKYSTSIILKAPDAYVLGYMSEERSAAENLLNIKSKKSGIEKRDLRSAVVGSDGKDEKANKLEEVEHDKPIKFQVVYVSKFALSIMYEYEEVIYNISAELKVQKRGCKFIKKEQNVARTEDNDYTKTIVYDDINSESQKVCPLENFEPKDNDTHVSFFVKVPAEVDFENSEGCFMHTHVEDDDESAKHKRSVIKIKNVIVIEDDPQNIMKEIEFVYPASLHNLMKYNKTIACFSKNLNFVVVYTFKEDKEVVKSVKFDTVVNDFTVEENRLSLQDYKWNDSVPTTTTGSYLLDSMHYMRRFQVYVDLLNNEPKAIENYNDFVSKYPKEMYQLVSMYTEEPTKKYAGVDFTKTSQHYEKLEEDITNDKTIHVHVIVPKEGTIVGLICPLENSDSLGELHCFDEVTDIENNRVKFEEFATNIPFSISPKIMVYNRTALGVESLLRLNEDSYNALDALTDAIQFRCNCKVNKHKVTLKFAIGTASSKFPDKTDEDGPTPEPEPEPTPDPEPNPQPSRSTRSILSSAVVLLVLLNVFSCIGFLN